MNFATCSSNPELANLCGKILAGLVHAAFDHLVSTNVVGTSRRLGIRIAQNALGRVRLPHLRRLRCTHLLLYRLINDVLLHFRS